MAHDLKIGEKTFSGVDKITVENTSGSDVEFIVPSGTKTITANGTVNIKNYAKVKVNVPTESGEVSGLQWASGFEDCTAGQSFRVEGLGFTPKGYAFMLMSNITENTDITNSTNSLFYCFYDTETNTMRRSVGTNKNYTLRVNPSATSGSVFDGGFEQKASSNETYNVMGQRYFWIAWG
jgi:hypothetical protein